MVESPDGHAEGNGGTSGICRPESNGESFRRRTVRIDHRDLLVTTEGKR
jgi:hypothetical protein